MKYLKIKQLLIFCLLFCCQKRVDFDISSLKNKVYIDTHFFKKENGLMKKEILDRLDSNSSSPQTADYILFIDSYQIEGGTSDVSGVPFIKRNSFIARYTLFEIVEKSPQNMVALQEAIDGDSKPFEYLHPEVGNKFYGIGVIRDRVGKIIQRKMINEAGFQETNEGRLSSLSFLKKILFSFVMYNNMKPINLYNMEAMHTDDIETYESFAIRAASTIFDSIVIEIMKNKELKKRLERKKNKNGKIDSKNDNTDEEEEEDKIDNNVEDQKDDKEENENNSKNSKSDKNENQNKEDEVESIEYEKYKKYIREQKQGLVEDVIDFIKDQMAKKKKDKKKKDKKGAKKLQSDLESLKDVEKDKKRDKEKNKEKDEKK